MKPKLVVLAGPTAAGKSALALGLAQRLGGHVLVVDSRQVYRGLDVGTAKATAEQRAHITHHGVDLVEVDQPFDAAKFRAAGAAVIADAHARHVPLVVEGGTGLYLRALLHGMMELPSRDDGFRAALVEEAGRLGWPALHNRLRGVDPAYAQRVAATDPVRITRALEVHHLTGKPFSEHERAHAFADQPYEVLGFLVDQPRAEHALRVNKRVALMWDGGLLDEARWLRGSLPADHPLLGTINYAQALDHLDGHCTPAQARAQMALRTVQFAKRQRTWFKKETWLRPLAPDWETQARAFLQ